MIRGFAALPRETRATLTIVGDGICRASLEQLVDELGERQRIAFTGATNDVAAILAESDVYVSTSLSEGMSNSLLEAMSFGLMPLVSRVSGAADMIDDGRSGRLFAPGDLNAFATTVADTIAMSPEARRTLGTNARAAAAERFGIDRVAVQHVALYEALLPGTD